MEKLIKPIQLQSGILQKYIFIEVLSLAFSKKSVISLLNSLNKSSRELLIQEKAFIEMNAVDVDACLYSIKTILQSDSMPASDFFAETLLDASSKKHQLLQQEIKWEIVVKSSTDLLSIAKAIRKNSVQAPSNKANALMVFKLFENPLQGTEPLLQLFETKFYEDLQKCFPRNTEIIQPFGSFNLYHMSQARRQQELDDLCKLHCHSLEIIVDYQKRPLYFHCNLIQEISQKSNRKNNFTFLLSQELGRVTLNFLEKLNKKEKMEHIFIHLYPGCNADFIDTILKQVQLFNQVKSLKVLIQPNLIENDKVIQISLMPLLKKVEHFSYQGPQSTEKNVIIQNLHSLQLKSLTLQIQTQKEVESLIEFMKNKSQLRSLDLTFSPIVIDILNLKKISGIQLHLQTLNLAVDNSLNFKKISLSCILDLTIKKPQIRNLRSLSLHNVHTSFRFWQRIGKYCNNLQEIKVSINSENLYVVFNILSRAICKYKRLQKSLKTVIIQINCFEMKTKDYSALLSSLKQCQQLEVFQFKVETSEQEAQSTNTFYKTLDLLSLPNLRMFSQIFQVPCQVEEILEKLIEEISKRKKTSTKHILVNITFQTGLYMNYFIPSGVQQLLMLFNHLNKTLKERNLRMTLAMQCLQQYRFETEVIEILKQFDMLEVYNRSMELSNES